MSPAQAASRTTAIRSSEGSVSSPGGLSGSELGLVTQNRYIHCQLMRWERQGRPGCLAFQLPLISVAAGPQRQHTGKPLQGSDFPSVQQRGAPPWPPLYGAQEIHKLDLAGSLGLELESQSGGSDHGSPSPHPPASVGLGSAI